MKKSSISRTCQLVAGSPGKCSDVSLSNRISNCAGLHSSWFRRGCSSFKVKQPEPEGDHRPLSQMKNKNSTSLYVHAHVFLCSLMFHFLERSGKCTYRPVNRKKTCVLSAECIYVFSNFFFSIKSPYFPNLLSPICFSNRSTVYSVWSTTWILIYNAD